MLEELNVKWADDETDSTTIGGFVTERLDKMPSPGDKLTAGGMEFEVLKATDKKVQEIKVTVLPQEEEQE